jgi:murein L,D-transpeptidase YafK
MVWANFPFYQLENNSVVSKVLVEKSERRLTLLYEGDVLASYSVSLGTNPVGDKVMEGDLKTPEGKYLIDWHNPESQSYLSLHISYPGPDDLKRGKEMGVDPGKYIMIHGIRNGFGFMGRMQRFLDWTEGCIAVTNWEMKEIFHNVKDGTPIEILP